MQKSTVAKHYTRFSFLPPPRPVKETLNATFARFPGVWRRFSVRSGRAATKFVWQLTITLGRSVRYRRDHVQIACAACPLFLYLVFLRRSALLSKTRNAQYGKFFE